MRVFVNMVVRAVAACGVAAAVVLAQAPQAQPTAVIFENVRVFDGKTDRLSGPSNVLVVGNTIGSVSAGPVTPPSEARVTRVAGGGRTLMPGLIDAHTHVMFAGLAGRRPHGRHRVHQHRGREERQRDVDAWLHERA
jgi:imidazolonepropionase-like amidohydrolase